ncbi:MAG: hypothetical protein WBP29_12190 [Candidatus Zixiibacteriota bacterium]
MNQNLKHAALALLLRCAFQLAAAGCPNQAPLAPPEDQQVSATVLTGSQVTTTTGTSNSAQNPQIGWDARTASGLNTRFVRDEVFTTIAFTDMNVSFNVATQTIRLMEMPGEFKTWIGHITENSELIGLRGEAITLADFGVCSQAMTSGEIINDDEFEINFLQMKNF